MNRKLLFFLGLSLVGVLAQLYFPWWTLWLVAFLFAFWADLRLGASLLLAFLAGALIWGGYAVWIDQLNQGLLSDRMGELFGGVGRAGILAITFLLGGILATLGSWAGNRTRRLFA